MESRKEELLQLRSQIHEIDADFTMILQYLQWDRKQLIEDRSKVICKYDANHRVSPGSEESHEFQCRLVHYGYKKEDKMLPEPFDNNAKTLVRLSNNDIKQIISEAENVDPSLKKVLYIIVFDAVQYPFDVNVDIEPQTLDRLQSTYTADERRAIHDAVVRAAPFCHDLSDLALLNEQGQENTSKKQKSRVEILAELRDMKRRRTKYRVAAKTRNYSDVLRDVIKTQMEVYSEVNSDKPVTNTSNGKYKDIKTETSTSHKPSKSDLNRPTYEYHDRCRTDTKEHRRRPRFDEERPSYSKKTRPDETESSTNYKDGQYDYTKRRRDGHSHRDDNDKSKRDRHSHKEEYDDKRKKDRHSIRPHDDNTRTSDKHFNRDKRRHNDRYSVEKNKDRRHYKLNEVVETKEGYKYERNDVDKYKKEKHSFNRDHREEYYDSKRYYSGDSKKDKLYSEYRKLPQ